MRLLLLFIFPGLITLLSAQDADYLLQEFKSHKAEVKGLSFNQSNKLIATGGEDKLLCIYNTLDGSLAYEHNELYFPVKAVRFFGNNQLFITAGNDIRLIDLNNKTLALYEGNTTHFWSIDFAPERNKVTGGSYDKKIRVWDVTSTKVDVVLEGHEKSVLPVAFSMGEKYIVTGSRDQTVKVWNAKTGEIIHSLERHSDNIYDVEFHPNEKYFASASGDKTVRLWDIETGKVVKTYTGHDAAIMDIDFSPDGYFLYTASLDGVVMIYEVATGNKLHSYILHEGPVNVVKASSNGSMVATGGKDGKVYLWESAKAIAVDMYFNAELIQRINSNPVFSERRKGESKEEYKLRKEEAILEKQKIINELFRKYEEKNNYKNTP